MKDTLMEIKNNLQGNNSRVDEDENQINNLEHKESKNNQNNKKKKDPKNRGSYKHLWENFKRCNIHIRWVPEGKEEQEIGNLFEKIMTENFPNLVKEIDMQAQEAQRIPNKRDAKRATPRHHN